MASGGPKVQISQTETQKFQAILRLPAGAEKTKLIQALDATEKTHFQLYVEILKKKQRIKQLEDEKTALQAREEALLRQDQAYLASAAHVYAPKLDTVAPNKSSAPVVTGKYKN